MSRTGTGDTPSPMIGVPETTVDPQPETLRIVTAIWALPVASCVTEFMNTWTKPITFTGLVGARLFQSPSYTGIVTIELLVVTWSPDAMTPFATSGFPPPAKNCGTVCRGEPFTVIVSSPKVL